MNRVNGRQEATSADDKCQAASADDSRKSATADDKRQAAAADDSRKSATADDKRQAAAADDTFSLYDLKVEVVAGDRPFVCSHRVGDYFLVQGENLVFPEKTSFSMYALSAILPLLSAKERELDRNDWMLSDAEIACPDPNCGARFRISRTGKRIQSHGACTVVPLPERD